MYMYKIWLLYFVSYINIQVMWEKGSQMFYVHFSSKFYVNFLVKCKNNL